MFVGLFLMYVPSWGLSLRMYYYYAFDNLFEDLVSPIYTAWCMRYYTFLGIVFGVLSGFFHDLIYIIGVTFSVHSAQRYNFIGFRASSMYAPHTVHLKHQMRGNIIVWILKNVFMTVPDLPVASSVSID